MKKYYNKKTKNEALLGHHFTILESGFFSDGDIVEIGEDNAFFAPLPKGHKLTFDNKGLPSGTEKVTVDPAELEAALYRAAINYQNSQIDVNLSSELQKSESIVEAGVLLEVDLPKAKACGEWLAALWSDYYTRKADTANSSTDFSNNGDCPHSFAEVRDERKAVLNA